MLKTQLTESLLVKLLLCGLFTFPSLIIAKTIHIGIIKDGTNQREVLPLEQIKREIINLK